MPDGLGNLLQQNLLILLAFDYESGKIIRNTVELSLFEGEYRQVAAGIYDFLDTEGKAPEGELATVFDTILEGKNERKAAAYDLILQNLYESQDSVQADYTLNRVNDFIRRQRLKASIIEAGEMLQEEDDKNLTEVEEILTKVAKPRADLFTPGTWFTDLNKSLSFLDASSQAIATGIKELDFHELGPSPGEILLLIAFMKRGKTWWLMHLAKMAMLQGKRVCHVTMEMSEKKIMGRYFQSLFSIPKRYGSSREPIVNTILKEDSRTGEFLDFERVKINPDIALQDPEIEKHIRDEMDFWEDRLKRKLLVKQFPTGQLTVNELRGFLDLLSVIEGWRPDLLLIDYPDLMKIDPRNYRRDLGNIYVDIRGLAVELNVAAVVASQSSKEGVKSSKVRDIHAAEDISKVATVDCVITYSQSPQEKRMGLARLFVSNARTDMDNFTILISQNYTLGQFVLSSHMMMSDYWDLLEEVCPKSDVD
ncbi:hypothetical protein LCGC14_0231470 [marine sediment metagenome]|uniref:Uncharacterized protein n=1 Tax=marine sediment metagenome TaxID=412755 RepID=A0A0F9UA15_9ZZZZ